ncbi:FtsX-like permease family protein [Actinoallomurus sp. NPDC050550]|uniref:FtsX-like permease family protein n=1 Tax=Actinoallomurus sp. NPDC050550 TaxID=3154937 RepID=UPI0033F7B908
MRALLTVAGMLGHGGSPPERARVRLMATGAGLATWFLFGAANVLALHGQLDDHFGPIANPGTRGGTAFGIALLLLPVTAFLYQSGRLAAADRERRLSALRLAGATPREVRILGAVEVTRTAVLGTVVGAASYLLLQLGARSLLPPRSPADVDVPPLWGLAAMAIVIGAAAVSGLLAGRHVIATPLGVTRRANVRPPRWYGLLLLLPPCTVALAVWLLYTFVDPGGSPDTVRTVDLLSLLLLPVALMWSAGWVVWFAARWVGRRAGSAETLLASRALEADARPWGRTLAVVGLTVSIGTGVGLFEADFLAMRDLDPFAVTSFTLLSLALLVAIVVTAAALLVHQAESLLERGPVMAALRAGGASERELRRVLTRQGLIASVPVCGLAVAASLVTMAVNLWLQGAWSLWAIGHSLLLGGLSVLATVLVTRVSRRRLHRVIAPERLRTE